MTKQPDGAFLFWARDWLTDEAVVLMSPAAKGIYIDLLCHCWLEGSIPSCSTQCSRIARMDAEAFAVLWIELAPLFVEQVPGSGRLVNKRLELEREKQDERRKSRVDKAKAAAEARWSDQPRKGKRHTQSNAPSNARSTSQALLGNAHQTKPSTTPLTPQGEGPTPGGVEALAPLAAEPSRAQEQRARRDGASPVSDLTTALMATPYRAGVSNAIARRGVVGAEARRLAGNGLTTAQVAELAKLAGEKSNGDPGALLAHWLDGDEWRSVLDEDASKAKERTLRRAAQPQGDDLLAGIYDDRRTKTAASVLEDILPQRAEGA